MIKRFVVRQAIPPGTSAAADTVDEPVAFVTHAKWRGISDVSRRHVTSVNVPGWLRSLR